MRAAEPAEAAHCLRQLGEYERAAQLYQDSGNYELAASAYRESGQHEIAAWIYVHDLGQPQVARDILELAGHSAVTPGMALRKSRTASADRLLSWHDQIGIIRDRLSDAAPGPDPAADTAADATRRRIAGLAAELIGDSGGRRDLDPFLVQIEQLKQAAMSQSDWPTGYAARELERLLMAERDARLNEHRAAESRHDLELVRTLSRRQVQARCDVADGLRDGRIIPVLRQTQELLADRRIPWWQRTETWGVAIAAAIRRYDQVALTFAAAVRGHRPGAAQRWSEWSAQVLKINLTMPTDAGLG